MANLSALLEKEASAEIDVILSEARSSASEIIAKAQAEVEVLLAQGKKQSVARYEAALVRAKSAAQLEASSLKLRAQHSAVESVLAATRQQIETLSKDSKKYEAVLKKLLDEAIKGFGGAKEVAAVVVNPKDEQVAKKLSKTLGIESVELDDGVQAGIRLRGHGGKVSLENTLFGRLEALSDELASEVSNILFASKGS